MDICFKEHRGEGNTIGALGSKNLKKNILGSWG